MTSRSLVVARRYGHALLDVALVNPEGPAVIHERLLRLRDILAKLPQAGAFLSHPGVVREKKESLLRNLLPEETAGGPLTRLLWILIERRRLPLLPAIVEAFVAQWNAGRGLLPANVVSAAQLDAGQRDALRASLQKAVGVSVELTARVDPALGGGLVVSMGGRTLDGSVRGRLRTLRERLRHAAVAR
jgi:F-type H+-transporting ATPase subunit delta